MVASAVESIGMTALGITSPSQLHEIVTRALDRGPVEVANLTIDEVPYDIPALTTRGRYRVHGTATQPDGGAPVSMFVKVVQSWARSPFFQFVPIEVRELALAQLPWEIEPLIYRSDLAQALPEGLRMPKVYGVIDLDAESAAIWMEHVAIDLSVWDYPRYDRAAYLLARFAAEPAVAAAVEPLRSVVAAQQVRDYVYGRVTHDVVPGLRSASLWQHPLVDRHFAGLRPGLLRLVDQLPRLLDELDTMPTGICHGDACTRNLLRIQGSDDLVLIDFGFVRYAPLGIDLGQLVLGEIQLGERGVDDLELLWARCVEHYARGVREAGSSASQAQIARASALCMAIFSGVSAIPTELLDQPPSPRHETIFAARAEVARFLLKLVDCS